MVRSEDASGFGWCDYVLHLLQVMGGGGVQQAGGGGGGGGVRKETGSVPNASRQEAKREPDMP